jgi:hypothetical protein
MLNPHTRGAPMFADDARRVHDALCALGAECPVAPPTYALADFWTAMGTPSHVFGHSYGTILHGLFNPPYPWCEDCHEQL